MGRGVGDLCLLRPGRRAPNPSAVTHPSMRYGVTPWLESRTQVSNAELDAISLPEPDLAV